ncbi:MAG: DUF5617 domain-containing protein [Gammaproteobacteria bacterium]
MFRRLYAITDRVTLGYPYSENIPDGDRIEEVRSYHHATPQELTRDSIQEANDLKNFPQRRKTLRVFTTLAAANNYAQESMTYNYMGLEGTGRLGSPLPGGQHAVAEMMITTENSHEWLSRKEPAGSPDEYQYGQKIPQQANKEHHFIEIPNNPENYMIHRVSMETKKFGRIASTSFMIKPDEFVTPKTYQNMIAIDPDDLTRGIIQLFKDYHSPRHFSFHWNRHHKKDAIQIANYLAKAKTLKEVYDFLFSERKRLIKLDHHLNRSGSFMRRLEFALTAIYEKEGEKLLIEPKKESELKL